MASFVISVRVCQ